jgi:hypothetical protein
MVVAGLFETAVYIYGATGAGIARSVTGYGLDSPGIESRWGRDFSHRPNWP